MPPFPSKLLLLPHFWPQPCLHMLYIYCKDISKMEILELTRALSQPEHASKEHAWFYSILWKARLLWLSSYKAHFLTLSENGDPAALSFKTTTSFGYRNQKQLFSQRAQVKLSLGNPIQGIPELCCSVTPWVCIMVDFNYMTTCCSPHLFCPAEEQEL